MKKFEQFTLKNSDLVFGGDLIVTGFGDDLYDTETRRVIYIDID